MKIIWSWNPSDHNKVYWSITCSFNYLLSVTVFTVRELWQTECFLQPKIFIPQFSRQVGGMLATVSLLESYHPWSLLIFLPAGLCELSFPSSSLTRSLVNQSCRPSWFLRALSRCLSLDALPCFALLSSGSVPRLGSVHRKQRVCSPPFSRSFQCFPKHPSLLGWLCPGPREANHRPAPQRAASAAQAGAPARPFQKPSPSTYFVSCFIGKDKHPVFHFPQELCLPDCPSLCIPSGWTAP